MTRPWIEIFRERHDGADREKSYSWAQVEGLLNFIEERELLIEDLREQRNNLRKEINR